MEGSSTIYVTRRGSLAKTLQESRYNKRTRETSLFNFFSSFTLLAFWTSLFLIYMIFFIYLLVEIEAPIPESFKPIAEMVSFNQAQPHFNIKQLIFDW